MIVIKRKVGVFDSGVGGLTVLKVINESNIDGEFIFFADILRCPYGTKSPEFIKEYSRQIVSYLIKVHNIDLVLIACNTASIASFDYLNDLFDIEIYGIATYGVQVALQTTINKRIGVFATQASVSSHFYRNSLTKVDNTVEVFEYSCQDWVTYVEKREFNSPRTIASIKLCTDKVIMSGVDTIVLGCTHFPFLKDSIISNINNDNINIVDPAQLMVADIFSDMPDNSLYERTFSFYSFSTETESMSKIIKEIFNKEYVINYVDLSKY